MRIRLWSCAWVVLACGACRGAGWLTHTDPLGFRIDAPAGWQVAGDSKTGKAVITGPAGEQAIVWPVFIPGTVDSQAAPAILRRLASATGFDGPWRAVASPAANAVRLIAAAGDRTVIGSFAWVGSPSGAAGFLYVAAAPTASYAGTAAIFARIFETFRATGRAAGAKTPGALDMKWIRWQDPKENAFTLEVPAGWTVSGGAFRFAAVDIRKVVEATAPDGSIRITGGDAELPTFTEPNQMLAMTGFREGSWYSPGYGVNMLVRRYMAGAQFAREYVATRAARGCTGLTFSGSRPRSDVDVPLNRLMSGLAAAGGLLQIQSGEVTFTCEQNGRPSSGYYFAGSLRAGAVGMPGGIWHIEYLYGYLATREKAAQAQQIIAHMLSTYADNPQWLAMQQNVTAATSRIVAQTQQEVSKMISDTFAYKNQVGDEISRRRENATLGTVDVVDPVSGRQIKVENSSNYYWLDNRGVIAGTETDTKPGWNFQRMTALP